MLTGEYAIIGYQPGNSARRGTLGALHVASFDGHALRYVGAVGTGFSDAVAAMLRTRLDAIAALRCPVAGLKVKGAVWVTPDLQATVSHRGVTMAGELRHASYRGLVA